jgi:thiol-disulfide isomerase/thioredoxin
MSQFIAVTKPGCPACEETKPHLAKAESKIKKKVRFAHVNADEHPSVMEKYEIDAFPDFLYKNSRGQVHHMPWAGIPDVKKLVEWVDTVRGGDGGGGSVAETKPRGQCAQCGVDGHGVSPTVWGPPLWFVIHMVALMYPRHPTATERRETMNFFTGLADVLPCDYCKKHYVQELSTMDVRAFTSRDTLFAWTVAFHDSVSDRTHSTQPRKLLSEWRHHYKTLAYNAIRSRKTS